MTSGSKHQETEDDRQCKHCGLCYASPGLRQHEEYCDFQYSEHRLQELEDPFAISRSTDEKDLVG